MPVFFILVITLVILIRYEITRNSKAERRSSKAFWEREREASFTRNKDISGLDYINIPEDLIASLPSLENEEYTAALENLNALKGTKILNLTGITNTDLKASYGTGNFAFLSECDERFNTLYVSLKTISRTLKEAGYTELSDKIYVYLSGLLPLQ